MIFHPHDTKCASVVRMYCVKQKLSLGDGVVSMVA
jgi:hypothetical protein